MTTRRLAAILAADVVGFPSLVGRDEEGTHISMMTLQTNIVGPPPFRGTGRGALARRRFGKSGSRPCVEDGRTGVVTSEGRYVWSLPGVLLLPQQ